MRWKGLFKIATGKASTSHSHYTGALIKHAFVVENLIFGVGIATCRIFALPTPSAPFIFLVNM